MKYALKRLITGLGVGRETARPCYSLALAQVRWWLPGGGQPSYSERWGVRRADTGEVAAERLLGWRRS